MGGGAETGGKWPHRFHSRERVTLDWALGDWPPQQSTVGASLGRGKPADPAKRPPGGRDKGLGSGSSEVPRAQERLVRDWNLDRAATLWLVSFAVPGGQSMTWAPRGVASRWRGQSWAQPPQLTGGLGRRASGRISDPA